MSNDDGIGGEARASDTTGLDVEPWAPTRLARAAELGLDRAGAVVLQEVDADCRAQLLCIENGDHVALSILSIKHTVIVVSFFILLGFISSCATSPSR